MPKIKKIVWVLFFVVLVMRLFIAFSTHYFDYDSYYHIRHIEHITETGVPAFNDELSYGGGFFIFSPLFHYIIAAFSFMIPLGIIGKIIPNILYALLIPLTYYISKEITGERKLSIVAPIIIAFMPVLWSNIFTLDPLCMAIPLIFLGFYFMIKGKDKKNMIYFLLCIIASAILSPITIIIIPILWLYILFLRIEKIKERGALFEITIFLTFFILLIQFIFYKNAIVLNGVSTIWQNIPPSILANYFSSITILDIIAKVGILAFIFGLYEIYSFSFEPKERTSSLFISIVAVLGVLLWAKLIPIQTGMIILGVSISIVSIFSIKYFLEYFEKIKFKKIRHVTTITIIIFIITAVVPAVYYLNLSKQDVPSEQGAAALLWLKDNSEADAVVIGDIKDGFAINAIADRKSIVDGNFLMKPDVQERLDDIKKIYESEYETNALEALKKYDSKYILFGRNAKKTYNVTSPNFEDEKCFENVFTKKDVKIFKILCDLK